MSATKWSTSFRKVRMVCIILESNYSKMNWLGATINSFGFIVIVPLRDYRIKPF